MGPNQQLNSSSFWHRQATVSKFILITKKIFLIRMTFLTNFTTLFINNIQYLCINRPIGNGNGTCITHLPIIINPIGGPINICLTSEPFVTISGIFTVKSGDMGLITTIANISTLILTILNVHIQMLLLFTFKF